MDELLVDALLVNVFQCWCSCTLSDFLIIHRGKACFECRERLQSINNCAEVRMIERGDTTDVRRGKPHCTQCILDLGDNHREIDEHLPFPRKIPIGKNGAERLVRSSNFYA